MSRTSLALGVGGLGSFVMALFAEIIAKAGGLVLVGSFVAALAWWLWKRRIIGRPDPDDDAEQAALSLLAEQARTWLAGLGTYDGGTAAARWFQAHEPALRKQLDTTDPAADRVDHLAVICDALDAWYVRQHNGAALRELSERLAVIGGHAGRTDLQQLAAVRAATADRLLGDEAGAEDRLRQAADGRRHPASSAVEARRQHEYGLLHLARAERYEPGPDRNDAIRSARNSFDRAARETPRADLAADVAVHINRAVTNLYEHNPKTALDHLRTAAVRADQAHDASAIAHIAELSGVAAWLRGNRTQAAGYWEQAERRYADIEEHVGQARCLRHRAAAELANGNRATARRLLAESSALHSDPNARRTLDRYLVIANR